MRKIKNIILSVLLFSFTFLVIHDYVMESLDVDTQAELCYVKSDLIKPSGISSLDSISKLHYVVHHLDIPILNSLQEEMIIFSNEPSFIQVYISSNIYTTPHRPPLNTLFLKSFAGITA